MKITDVEIYVVDPTQGAATYNQEPQNVWTFIRVLTTLAETYHVPVTPHNAMGPLQVVADAHAMLAVPNFYRLEHNVANGPWYDQCLDRPLDLRGDQLHLSPRPGLGVDFDPAFLRAHRAHGWPGYERTEPPRRGALTPRPASGDD